MRVARLAALFAVALLVGTAHAATADTGRAYRAARIPAPRRRAGADELLAHAVVRVESRARRAALRVPARPEQHVPRQLRRLRRPQRLDARRGSRRDASVDHRQPALALCTRSRDHPDRRDAVEHQLRLRHGRAGGAVAAPELPRRDPVDAARRRPPLRGLVRRHPEVRRRRNERHRRARVLHVPPGGELDRHDPLARPRAPRRRRPRRAPPGPVATTRSPPSSTGRGAPSTARPTRRSPAVRSSSSEPSPTSSPTAPRTRPPTSSCPRSSGPATSRSPARPPSCTASTCSRTSSA